MDTNEQKKLIIKFLADNPWSAVAEIASALDFAIITTRERLNELHGKYTIERRKSVRFKNRAFEYILNNPEKYEKELKCMQQKTVIVN